MWLLTGTDAIPLDTSVDPYSGLLILSAFTAGYSEGAG